MLIVLIQHFSSTFCNYEEEHKVLRFIEYLHYTEIFRILK